MNQNNRRIRRVLIGVILFIISIYATLYIKDTVDSLNPEDSLPLIDISIGYTKPYVVRSGYSWHFGATVVQTPYIYDIVDVHLVSLDCAPNTDILIGFSKEYEILTVSSSKAGADFVEFTPVIGSPVTPEEEGDYIYMVEAKFEDGDILYYFAISVTHDAYNNK